MSGENRQYKDSVFTLLFKKKENLISLYNALEGKNYPLNTEIEINTLEEALFKKQMNDLFYEEYLPYDVDEEDQTVLNHHDVFLSELYFVRNQSIA